MPSRRASSAPLARLLYELSHGQAGGTVRLRREDGATAPLHLELFRGWVHAVDLSPAYGKVGPAPSRGEDRLRLFLQLALDEYAIHEHRPDAKPQKRGACTPFHPAQVLRNHVDALGRDPELFLMRAGAGHLQVLKAPHASCLGQDERPVVAFLARPRTLRELDAMRFVPRERAAKLLAFLDAVGALQITFDRHVSPWAALELPDGAPPEEVKRAFRRLARELHPDRHPGASEEELRDLERRFAEVNAAYRRLV